MLLPLDGPAVHNTLTVDNITVVEAKVGASALNERKVLTIQPDNKLYVYFGDGISTPSAGTVSTDGFLLFKNSINTYEASCDQPIFLLSDSGTINVKIAERG